MVSTHSEGFCGLPPREKVEERGYEKKCVRCIDREKGADNCEGVQERADSTAANRVLLLSSVGMDKVVHKRKAYRIS
jgi:hypothetical protein